MTTDNEIRNVYCDMCKSFRFPTINGYPKGICPMAMAEVGCKSTHARMCSGFTPARRCGCCAQYVTKPFQKQGKCRLTDKRLSTGSNYAEKCPNWEKGL